MLLTLPGSSVNAPGGRRKPRGRRVEACVPLLTAEGQVFVKRERAAVGMKTLVYFISLPNCKRGECMRGAERGGRASSGPPPGLCSQRW